MGPSDVPTLVNEEKAPEKAKTYGGLRRIIDIILAIGPYIHHEPKVLYKLLRIISYYLQKVKIKDFI